MWQKELLFGMHNITVALRTMKLCVNMSELRKKGYVQIEAGVAPTVIACNIEITRSTEHKEVVPGAGDFVQRTAESSRPRTTRTKAMVASVKWPKCSF